MFPAPTAGMWPTIVTPCPAAAATNAKPASSKWSSIPMAPSNRWIQWFRRLRPARSANPSSTARAGLDHILAESMQLKLGRDKRGDAENAERRREFRLGIRSPNRGLSVPHALSVSLRPWQCYLPTSSRLAKIFQPRSGTGGTPVPLRFGCGSAAQCLCVSHPDFQPHWFGLAAIKRWSPNNTKKQNGVSASTNIGAQRSAQFLGRNAALFCQRIHIPTIVAEFGIKKI